MITQKGRVLDYLKEHSCATSNELRSTLRIVDIPKVISTLVKENYPITARRNRDGTSTYYLGELPQPKAPEYTFIGNRAVPKTNLVMKQGRIF